MHPLTQSCILPYWCRDASVHACTCATLPFPVRVQPCPKGNRQALFVLLFYVFSDLCLCILKGNRQTKLHTEAESVKRPYGQDLAQVPKRAPQLRVCSSSHGHVALLHSVDTMLQLHRDTNGIYACNPVHLASSVMRARRNRAGHESKHRHLLHSRPSPRIRRILELPEVDDPPAVLATLRKQLRTIVFSSGVCEKNTPPEKNTGGKFGRQAFRAPNQGLESSLYCWTSWPRIVFSQTLVAHALASCVH